MGNRDRKDADAGHPKGASAPVARGKAGERGPAGRDPGTSTAQTPSAALRRRLETRRATLRGLRIAVIAGLAFGAVLGVFLFRPDSRVATRAADIATAAGRMVEDRIADGDSSAAGSAESTEPTEVGDAAAGGGAEASGGDRRGGDTGGDAVLDFTQTEATGDKNAGAGNDGSRPATAPAEATLSFTVQPAEAEDVAITVDGAPVDGRSHTVPTGTQVKIVVRARGFHTWRRRVTLTGDRDVRIRLSRREEQTDGVDAPSDPGDP